MNYSSKKEYESWQKLTLILVVIVVHASVWAFVNNYNSHLEPNKLNNLSTIIDQIIPYLGWSWFIYYAGHIYIIAGTSIAIWNYKRNYFGKIISLFCLMIVAGGIIQLILPAKSPLPEQMNSVHSWIHRNISHDPFVCFPSMHIALSALPTFLLFKKVKYFGRTVLSLTLFLMCISTITLKEHYFADVAAGILMSSLIFKFFPVRVNNLFQEMEG